MAHLGLSPSQLGWESEGCLGVPGVLQTWVEATGRTLGHWMRRGSPQPWPMMVAFPLMQRELNKGPEPQLLLLTPLPLKPSSGGSGSIWMIRQAILGPGVLSHFSVTECGRCQVMAREKVFLGVLTTDPLPMSNSLPLTPSGFTWAAKPGAVSCALQPRCGLPSKWRRASPTAAGQ